MAKRGFKSIKLSTDYTWATKMGTFAEIDLDSVALDSFQLGEPEKTETEMASNISDLDALRYTGGFRCKRGTTGLPVSNSRGWLEVTPHVGAAEVYGGEDGCKFHVYDLPLKTLTGGKALTQVDFQYVGEDSAAVMQDA